MGRTMIFTGRRNCLPEILVSHIRKAMADGDNQIMVVVPNQLTLETELMLLEALNLNGSFRINVVSPKRLCERVFEECGSPTRVTIDEQGRAMLMGRLLRKHESELKIYRRAGKHPGFELKLVEEIARFKQAGIDGEALRSLAEGTDEDTKAKINDIALLYDAYEYHIAGHMQDGEDEMAAASERMNGCNTLKAAYGFVYGFDITTTSINRVIAGLCSACAETRIYLPLPNPDERGMRESVYQPLEQAVLRLEKLLGDTGIDFTRTEIQETPPSTPIEMAVHELYRLSGKKVNADVNLCRLTNPLEEARYTAALIRSLVMNRGYRYRDINVVIDSPESYADVLDTAFGEYEVPYFTQESRTASTQPVCAFLNQTLSLITGKLSDFAAICETGFLPVETGEAEILMSYIKNNRLRPSSVLRPFTKGDPEKLESTEVIRKKAAEPILRLKDELKQAGDLVSQLSSVYAFLSDLNCFEKSACHRQRLIELGERELAADDIRVSNMLMGVFDQMTELFGSEPLSMSTLSDLIERALNAVVIKLLPQSPDSVQITSPQRVGMKKARAVFIMHGVSADSEGKNGLFDEREMRELSARSKKYIAPDALALSRTRRMYLKDALAMASEFISVTMPSGEMDGSALSAGTLISEFKRVLAAAVVRGGTDDNDIKEMERLRLSSTRGALAYITSGADLKAESAPLSEALRILSENGSLSGIRKACSYTNASSPIDRDIASALYGKRRLSITRLESFGKCPFTQFVSYALRPNTDEPYESNPVENGKLLHSCVERLMKVPDIASQGEEAAVRLMNEKFDEALADYMPRFKQSSTDLARIPELRRVARRAAAMLVKQLQKGVFKPVKAEVRFENEALRWIKLSDGRTVELTGQIDRIDTGTIGSREYSFVVDYKSGKSGINPSEIFAGLQLQLLTYLASVTNADGEKSAGVYYFSLKDEPVKTDSLDNTAVDEERRKQMRMDGIIPSNTDILMEIADEPEKLIKFELKKDKTLGSRSKSASADEFTMLMRHTMRKCGEFANSIYSGETAVFPVNGACDYCRYKPICQRDKHLRGNGTNRIVKYKFDELKEAVMSERDLPNEP